MLLICTLFYARHNAGAEKNPSPTAKTGNKQHDLINELDTANTKKTLIPAFKIFDRPIPFDRKQFTAKQGMIRAEIEQEIIFSHYSPENGWIVVTNENSVLVTNPRNGEIEKEFDTLYKGQAGIGLEVRSGDFKTLVWKKRI